MQNAGEIVYHAKINTKEFERNAQQISGTADKAGKDIQKSFTNRIEAMQPTFRKMAAIGTAAFAGVALGARKAINEAGEAEKIAENFENTFGESTDVIGGFIKDFGNEFAFVESEMMAGANNIGFQLNALGGLTKEEADNMTESLLTAAGGLSDFFGETLNVEQATKRLASGLSGNTQALLDMGYNVRVEDVENMAEAMGMNTDELSRSDKAMALTQLIMDQTEGSIEGLSAGMDTYTGRQRAARKATKEMTQSLGAVFLPMATKLMESLTPIIESMKTWIEANPELFKKIVMVVGGVTALIAAIGLLGMALPAIIAGFGFLSWPILAVAAALGAVIAIIVKKWSSIKPVVDKITDGFKQFWDMIKPIRDFIANQFKAAWEQIKQAVDDARVALEPYMPELKRLGKIIGIAIITPFGIAAAAIVGVVTVGATLIAWVARAIAWFGSLGSKVFSAAMNMKNSVVSAVGSIIGWFRSLPSRIWAALGHLGSTLYGSGISLIRGFLDGINAMANAPVDAVRNMVGRMRNLLPSSPAKEGPFSGSGWVDKSGLAIADGLASGMVKGTQNAVAAAQGLMTDLSTNLSPGMATVPSMASGERSEQNVTNNINRIEIANEVDGENWLRKLGREEEITEKGLTRG